MYLLLAVLGFCCCAPAFSSCGERASSRCSLLRSAGSRRVGFRNRSPQALERPLVVVAYGLMCPSARGISPDQGSNRCPLHWQVDSYPLDHLGSSVGFSSEIL